MFQFLFRRIFMEDIGQERPGPIAQCGEGEGRRAAAAAQEDSIVIVVIVV